MDYLQQTKVTLLTTTTPSSLYSTRIRSSKSWLEGKVLTTKPYSTYVHIPISEVELIKSYQQHNMLAPTPDKGGGFETVVGEIRKRDE